MRIKITKADHDTFWMVNAGITFLTVVVGLVGVFPRYPEQTPMEWSTALLIWLIPTAAWSIGWLMYHLTTPGPDAD